MRPGLPVSVIQTGDLRTQASVSQTCSQPAAAKRHRRSCAQGAGPGHGGRAPAPAHFRARVCALSSDAGLDSPTSWYPGKDRVPLGSFPPYTGYSRHDSLFLPALLQKLQEVGPPEDGAAAGVGGGVRSWSQVAPEARPNHGFGDPGPEPGLICSPRGSKNHFSLLRDRQHLEVGCRELTVKHTRATTSCGCSPTEVRVSDPPRPSPGPRGPGCGVRAAQSPPRRSRAIYGHEVSGF